MPTFGDWPRVRQPPPTATLWRYVSTAKLADLLSSSTVYLSRVDRFEDSFEGSIGDAGAATKRRMLREFARPTQDSSYYGAVLSAREKFRRFFYASCWHVREHESASMWSSYVGADPGVAIRTSFRRMRDAIPGAEPGRMVGGLVNYVNFRREQFDMLGPMDAYFFKRVEYSDECEYRFLYHHLPEEVYPEDARRLFRPQAEGFASSVRVDPRSMNFDVETPDHHRHPVDVNRLIEAIVLSPGSDSRYAEKIRELARSAGADCDVVASSLSSDPEF